MAKTRVRCVCGTVFDPTKKSACPACGSAYEATPAAKTVEPEPKPAPTPKHEQTIRQDTATGFDPDGTSFVEKHKKSLTLVGGVAGLLLLALIVRLISGGPPSTKTVSNPDAVSKRKYGSESTSRPHTPSSITPNPSPSDSSLSPQSVIPTEPPPVPQSDIPSFKGKWSLLTANMQPERITSGIPASATTISRTVDAAFTGLGATRVLTIDEVGGYVLDVDVTGEGQYTTDLAPAENLYSVTAQGTLTLRPKDGSPDHVRAMLKPVRLDVPHLNVKAGDTQLVLQPVGRPGVANATWVRPAGSGQPDTSLVGTWLNERIFVDTNLPYRAALDLSSNDLYRMKFTRTERGRLIASGGSYEFKRDVAIGPPMRGRYTFEGLHRVTFTEPRGTATWIRDDVAVKQPGGVRR
ncbi:MAG: hypothetical protein MI923_00755 [Phycisphaerales bacterium]|nr:hypothetical protein [Phycisphaerales bacterium]